MTHAETHLYPKPRSVSDSKVSELDSPADSDADDTIESLIIAAENNRLPDRRKRRLITQLAPHLLEVRPKHSEPAPRDLQDMMRQMARLIRILLIGYTSAEIDAMCPRVPVAVKEDQAAEPHMRLMTRIDEILCRPRPQVRRP